MAPRNSSRSICARRNSTRRSSLFFECLEERRLLAADWQNPFNRLDVNASGEVTPIDALVVINDLTRHDGSYELSAPEPGKAPPPYLDVNGNGFVEPLDVLAVINGLNADPETKSLLIQRFLVDVNTGEVRIDPAHLNPGDGSEGESLFIGSTIVFNSSTLLDQAGNAGRKVLNVSLTNRSGETLGMLPNGTITGLRVRFSDFKNIGPVTDIRTTANVDTIAGTGATGRIDGLATNATFTGPTGTAIDDEGNIYIADASSFKIRKISGGIVSTLAGSNVSGAKNGVGSAATFKMPYAIAFNRVDQSLIVADYTGHQIRRVTLDGVVSTIAGTGAEGDTNGIGSSATFRYPSGVAVDNEGNIYVSESGGHRIRKITRTGSAVNSPSSYTVSHFAGSNASPPVSGAVDGIAGFARFATPRNLTIDEDGNLYVADRSNRSIRMITQTAEVVTIAGTGAAGSVDGQGNIATFNFPQGIAWIPGTRSLVVSTDTEIRTVTLKEGAAPASSTSWIVDTLAGSPSAGAIDARGDVASFNLPSGLSVDASHNIYVADVANNLIRRVAPTNGLFQLGTRTAPAPTEPVQLSNPDGVIPLSNPVIGVDGSTGQLPYIEYDGSLDPSETTDAQDWSFIVPTGVTAFEFTVTVEANTRHLAPPAGSFNSKANGGGSPLNYVRTVAGRGVSGFVDGAATEARFNNADGIAVDSFGNRYVADAINRSIRRVAPDGTVTTVAGVVGQAAGTSDGTGDIAQFFSPKGIAVSDDGQTLYVTDHSAATIRRITLAPDADPTKPTSWTVTTIAGAPGEFGYVEGIGSVARFNAPYGIAVTSSGIVYVSEAGGHRIRRLLPNGGNPALSSSWVSSLVAGSTTSTSGSNDGFGLSARFDVPAHIAVDQAGNIYVADSNNNSIRKIDPDGIVSTLAGSSTPGFVDGPGTSAQFDQPRGIAVDSSGYVWVSDTFSHRIRRVSPTGDVTTVAGIGSAFPGDRDGTGEEATFSFPMGIDVDDSGSLHVISGGTIQFAGGGGTTTPGIRIRLIERIFSVGDAAEGEDDEP